MPLLRWGLNAGALVAIAAAVASWMAGYAMEVALLRGLLAFPLVAFAAYFAELVVSTAPPAKEKAKTAKADATPTSQELADGRAPVDLAQVRADRDASADSRAA
ncbi:MAG: hypothetical protein EPO65_09835 [Dehalococcoidia bacterium]|nr:MAG: hypothetical protein EPO65_09835 [Dehalococcoidia bacterium]